VPPLLLCHPSPGAPPLPQVTPKYEKSIRNLVDFCSQEFYRKSNAIEFVIDGNSHRSELRFNAEWSTNSAGTRRLRGRMQLPAPGRTVEQFTWMQVHGGEAAGVPLLRLYWLRSGKRNGKTRRDALLAAVRLNTKKEGTPRWGALYEGGRGGSDAAMAACVFRRARCDVGRAGPPRGDRAPPCFWGAAARAWRQIDCDAGCGWPRLTLCCSCPFLPPSLLATPRCCRQR